MSYRFWIVLAGVCLYPSTLPAQTWGGHADLGYSATSGNTDTESLNADFGLTYQEDRWLHKGSAKILSSQRNGDTEAERYQIGEKSEYTLSELSYLFGKLDHEHDEFGGIRTRDTLAAGYGRRLLDTDRHKLSVEIGPGFSQLRRQDGEREREAILHAGLDYLWHLSPTSELSQALQVESGRSDTYAESVSGVKLKIVGNLAAKLSYTIKRHSDVPAGSKKTDTYSLVALSYEFGENPTP